MTDPVAAVASANRARVGGGTAGDDQYGDAQRQRPGTARDPRGAAAVDAERRDQGRGAAGDSAVEREPVQQPAEEEQRRAGRQDEDHALDDDSSATA